MAKNKKKLVILDGNALIHRAWHALPPLTDPQGRVVNAVYGFTTVLLKMIKDIAPEYIVVTFDKPGKTFRHEEFEEYKATRVKQPDELYEQIPLAKEMLKGFDIPVFEYGGYEADDVIGTISKKLDPQSDVESIIVTGDLDTLQLVDKNTKVLAFVKGLSQTTLYDEKAVKERYGFGPEKLIDFKAIKGDPSDNIPGVSGIGDKGATDLIKEFGSLQNIYKETKARPDKFKKALLEKLTKNKDQAELSQNLVTIVTDLPIKFDLEKCRVGTWEREKLVKIFSEFGFKSLINKLPGSPAEKKQKRKTETFSNASEIFKYLKQINKEKSIAFSFEVEGGGLFGDSLVGLGIATVKGPAYLELAPLSKIEIDKFWGSVKPIFNNPKVDKIGYDLKRQTEHLANHGIELEGLGFDIMIASYLLASGTRTHDLESIILQELGKELSSESKNYSLEKIDFIWQLRDKLYDKLNQDNLIELFEKIEMPLIPVLAEMERNGIKIDAAYLKKMAVRVETDLKKITKKIYKLSGEEFNINSPQQLKEILFEKLSIPTAGIRRGKTGLSTAAPELEKLRHEHPIIDLIFEHRELSKLKSTYIDALPNLINKKTKRVHTSFNQTVTATGRLSSSNPNLQNIPIRTELGREIRKAFVADRGKVLIAADYSQIELRIVAALAGDKRMIQAFQENKDIHTTTAAAIWDVPENKVDKDMRRAAKAINFGIIYGQGPHGLAQSADISFNEARDFIDKYFAAYSRVKEYMDRTKALARKFGYVETIFNRRRYLPDITSGLPQVRAAAERMAINMPVQGTAADIMKMAMIKIHNGLPKISRQSKMVLQVHDELVFEAPEQDTKKVAEFVREEMENIYKLKVPIIVDVETGKNWEEMKKI